MKSRPTVIAASLALLTSCIGGEPLMEVPRSDCEALRDHVVDIAIAAAAGSSEPSERLASQLERHRQNLRNVYGDSFLTSCQLETSPEYIQCALEAGDKAGLSDCKDL